MILLRFLALLAGGLILVVPPLFMFSGTSGPEFFDGRTVAGVLAATVAVASAFFFIGFAGERMRKSVMLRSLGGVLLAAPFVAGVTMLLGGDAIATLWLAGALICLAITFFAGFVFPAIESDKHRPMRRREPREPALNRLAQS